jgi:hypothetical protein
LHNKKITQTHGKLKPIRRVELDRKNRVAIDNINDTLLKLYPQTELKELDVTETGFLLEQIVRTTVQAARINMPRTPCPNKKMHDGWTPTYSVYFHQLNAFKEIRRHLCGQHGRERWRTTTQRKEGIRIYLNKWTDTLNNYDFTPKEKNKLLQKTGTNPEQWHTANNLERIHVSAVTDEIKVIKKSKDDLSQS